MPLLEIRGLTVEFPTHAGLFRAVDGVDLTVEPGDVLGIVGESGSGKSVSMLAIMGLLPKNARITAERLAFDGHDLRGLSARQRRKLVGKDMAIIFQEPMTSLNPCFTVGYQLKESLRVHEGLSGAALQRRAVELLEKVGIPAPESRLRAFPHQLSGGMNQRVMIAIGIACNPRLLIADEPTTALDVTIQKQILDLLVDLQRERGMALVMITHDMGVVAERAQRVCVMYAGQIMEQQPSEALFTRPHHPYTAALLDALPERALGRDRLPTIPGVVPGLHDRPAGCLFNPRCQNAQAHCRAVLPALAKQGPQALRCFYPVNDSNLVSGDAR
ncbi:MAG TPA: ABC transporter ATP-binding protein [Alphaproteobacteria bacterium]|nr:ABC transporter ATP-binding protein [Alphaproteobacteria bacterium]